MPRVPPVTTATLAMRSSRYFTFSLIAFDAHRDPHSAADAQGRQTLLEVAPLHLVQQRHQHPPPGRADRMTERDGAAVHVDLLDIPAEILVDRASLGGEGLVGLDQVEIAGRPARLLQRHA